VSIKVSYASLICFIFSSAKDFSPLKTSGWYFLTKVLYAFLISLLVAVSETPKTS
jgi:hypothetical protein